MQVFLEKNTNKFHNLFFNQLMMYFSFTLLSLCYQSSLQKMSAGEYCVHNVKRDDVVYICVHMGLDCGKGGEWIPRNQGVSGTNRLLFA